MAGHNFFKELKRRNVYKVATTYIIAAWLLIQVSSILLPTFDAPDWVMKVVTYILVIGFPIALILAWAFEMSPEGIVRTSKTKEEVSPTKKWSFSNILIGILLIVIVGQFIYNRYWDNSTDVESIEKSIAVLPFRSDSPNEENKYFCNGVMNSIHNHLSKIPDLRVVSLTSVEKYRDNPVPSITIAEELDVNYLVTGSVQRVSNQAIISAQLVQANSDETLWSEPYDRDLEDIFEVQAEVTRSIADKLHALISPEVNERIDKVPTENMEAYDLYNAARNYQLRYLKSRNFEELDRAESIFQQAIALDSTFALAYAGVAQVYLYRRGGDQLSSIHQLEFTDKYGEYSLKALQYDEDLAEALIIRGSYYLDKGDPERARIDYKNALVLNPNLVMAHESMSNLSHWHDRDMNNAFRHLKIALSLEKEETILADLYTQLGIKYMVINDLKRSEEYLNRAFDMQPNNYMACAMISWLMCQHGKFEEAFQQRLGCFEINKELIEAICFLNVMVKDFEETLQCYDRWDEIEKTRDVIQRTGDPNRIYALRQLGKDEEARQLLEDSNDYWSNQETSEASRWIFENYAAIGDEENAMHYLKNYGVNNLIYNTLYPFINYYHVVEVVWDNPEFIEMMKKVEEGKKRLREEVSALEMDDL